MLSRLTSFGPAEPWALWQSEQVILPSGIGWCEGRCSWVRCSLWQAMQTSVCVSLASTLSWLACILWHESHARSADSCGLPPHSVRLASLAWQPRQVALRSLAGVAVFLVKTRSGRGRSFAPWGLLTWVGLGPWQVTQPGVRGSAATACALRLMSGRSSASWHLTQALEASASSPAKAGTPSPPRHRAIAARAGRTRMAPTSARARCPHP